MEEPRTIHTPGLVPPKGYADGAVAPPGSKLVVLGGHVAFDGTRTLLHPYDLVPQVKIALINLRATLAAAGATPTHLVKLTIHTTDVQVYRQNQRAIGVHWREVLGKVYPAMTLLGVAALYDEGAMVEIDGLAAIPAR